jgi:3-dehydroquinate dehydratase-2
MLDALLASELPCVEVHLSNIFQRESFRHNSYISKGVKGVICGFGPLGYELAVEALIASIEPKTQRS